MTLPRRAIIPCICVLEVRAGEGEVHQFPVFGAYRDHSNPRYPSPPRLVVRYTDGTYRTVLLWPRRILQLCIPTDHFVTAFLHAAAGERFCDDDEFERLPREVAQRLCGVEYKQHGA